MKLPEKYNPHIYQKEAIQHVLSKPYSGLFLPPGLGKTSIILAAIKVLLSGEHIKGVLLVAPLRVVKYTWQQEADKWLQFERLKFVTLHGKDKDELLKKKADIYLINFEGLLWLLPKLAKMKVWPFDMLVIDESTKMKAYNSARFKKLKPLLGGFSRRVILTGTPAPNSMMDLFAQAYIMDRGRALGAYITHFRNEYFYVDMGRHKPGDPPNAWEYKLQPGAEERIRKALESAVYTSNGEGYVADQTPLVNDIYVELPEAARRQYKTMENVLFSQLQTGVVLAANAAVASGKCRQIANGHLYTDDQGNYEVLHDEKLAVVEDLLEELNGQPVLLWYEYKSDLDRLQKQFPGEVLTAKSPPDIVDRWNRGEIPLLYMHHQSGGHGLNMQFGGNVHIWFSTCWSNEDYMQAIARLARQGQKNRVIVHRIIARHTVDEVAIKVLGTREANQEAFLTALREYWSAQ